MIASPPVCDERATTISPTQEMTAAGLVVAYALARHESGFVSVDPAAADASRLWFRITPARLAELEADWVDE